MADAAQQMGGLISYPFAMADPAAVALALLSNSTPPSEANMGSPGDMTQASRGNHSHQRLTNSFGDQVLAADGTLTIAYVLPFINFAPSVTPTAETPAAGTLPPTLTYKHVTATINGVFTWTGVTITGTRPGPITVGILGIAVAQTTVAAAGSKFSLLAVKSSQT